jgi:hypothetical protein
MDKEYVVHIYNVIYTIQPLKMDEIHFIVTIWMKLEMILLSEVNQAQKAKYHVI